MAPILVAAALATATAVLAPAATGHQDPAPAEAPPDPAREALREELAAELASPVGFRLVETGPLFVLSQVHDRRFLDELSQRIELLQAVIERDFPLEVREGQPPPPPVVVRLYGSQQTYVGAGGPEGSSNYVDADGKRFLVYDQRAGGRRDFWRTFAGLQFKAHWVRAVGLPWPHGWMLHGHEDYYGGYELHGGRLVRKPNPWRQGTARQLARQGTSVGFHELLRWLGPGYSGGAQRGLSIQPLEVYAQGWSLVWFLRTLPGSERKPEGWQASWELILDRYLAGMRTTHDKGAAVDAALDGVDLTALEAAWRESLD
jgi:hypothetical protein